MGMEANHDDTVTVRSTIDLARNRGFTVVAEGVETEEALATARAIGCDPPQGFLLSRPVPVDQLDRRLSDESGVCGSIGAAR